MLLATIFQVGVLTATFIAQPVPAAWYWAAVVGLLPINVLIFALENLIFLLYPYRATQEGVAVFLRSVLTFTAKGLLFTAALVVIGVVGLAARQLATNFAHESSGLAAAYVFGTGLWLFCLTGAGVTTALLVRVYRRYDPGEDTPAVS